MNKIFSLYLLILSTFLLTGCFSKPDPSIKPKLNHEDSKPEASVFTAQILYKDSKLVESLLEIEKSLKLNPNDSEAIFLKALIYFKTNKYAETHKLLSQLNENQKMELAESCIELQELNSPNTNKELVKISKSYFPDCLEDLVQKDYLSDPLDKFTKQQILKLGKLYDQAISKSDDDNVKKKIEDQFMKQHNLSNEELNHITSNYLEVLAEEL
ncbi:MAG: CDC27 family protein [Candidatus Cloacimonetes bacterium]|nr:CDC27 family protein [Candidatus Cloacimonadota bacterium]